MVFNFQSPVAHDGLPQILQTDLTEHNLWRKKYDRYLVQHTIIYML